MSWSNSLLCCILKFAAVFIKKELRLWAGFISFLIAKLFSSRIHFNFSYYWREVALSCNVYHIVTTYMRKKKSRKVLLQLLACVINLLSIKKDCRLLFLLVNSKLTRRMDDNLSRNAVLSVSYSKDYLDWQILKKVCVLSFFGYNVSCKILICLLSLRY